MNEELIHLPIDKTEKAKLLFRLYVNSIHTTDKLIFEDILERTVGTSLRSLKMYKKEFEWSRTTIENKNPQPKVTHTKKARGNKKVKTSEPDQAPEENTPTQLKIIKTLRQYNDEDKLHVIREICDYYSSGEFSLRQACVASDIPVGTFLIWVNTNTVFFNIYDKAERVHKMNYATIVESYAKEYRLKGLQEQEVCSEMEIIDLTPTLEGGYHETPVRKIKKKHIQSPDKFAIAEAQATATRMKSEVTILNGGNSNDDIKSMSDDDLKEEFKRLMEGDTDAIQD